MDNVKMIDSANQRIPSLQSLASRIAEIKSLIDLYTNSGRPLPPAVKARLPELRSLEAAFARIKNRIDTGERTKAFLTPIQLELPAKRKNKLGA